jgi:hypothetical protein
MLRPGTKVLGRGCCPGDRAGPGTLTSGHTDAGRWVCAEDEAKPMQVTAAERWCGHNVPEGRMGEARQGAWWCWDGRIVRDGLIRAEPGIRAVSTRVDKQTRSRR